MAGDGEAAGAGDVLACPCRAEKDDLMHLGGVSLIVAFALWFLLGLGVRVIPGAEAFAHAALCLGLLLTGYPVVWWRQP